MDNINIVLDINSQTPNYVQPFNPSVGDGGLYQFTVNIVNSGVPFNLANLSAKITFGKADGTSTFSSMTITNATSGIATYTIQTNDIAFAGEVNVEIVIYDTNTSKLTSSRFSFYVKKGILNDNTVQSTNEFSALTTALNTVSEIENKADKSYVDSNLATINTSLAGKANQSDLNTTNNNIYTITTKQSNNLGVYSWNNLFSDGFEYQDLFKFKYKNGSDASAWTFSNGAISSGTNATDATICLVKDKKFIDGRIDLVSSNPSTSSSWFGIVIGYKESTNACMMVILRLGKLEVWTWDETNFNHLSSYDGTLNDQDTTITNNTSVTLSIEKHGNYVICYVNERYITAFEDNFVHTMSNGMLGIIADNVVSHTFTNFIASSVDFSIINSTNISKIIFLGSSITNGVNQNTKYRDLVCQSVQTNMTGKILTGINGGVNGSTTTDMLSRLPSLIVANPDATICIIEGSVNDVKITGSITSDITKANIRTMIRMCKQYSIIPIITTPTPIIYGFGAVGSAPDWSAQSWIQLCDMSVKIRQLAKEEGVRLIDNARRFGQYTLGQKEAIITDGVHPNDTGAQNMAQDALNSIMGNQVF